MSTETRVEYADGPRSRVFPAEWGQPPADLEDRALWIKRNVAEQAGVAYHRRLQRRDARVLAELRLVELSRKAEPPGA